MLFPSVVRRVWPGVATLIFACSMALPTAAFDPISLSGNNPTIELSVLGTWRSGNISSNTPEGPVYDPRTQRVFVGSEDRNGIDVIDISTPASPTKIDLINIGGDASGMAVSPEGILAVSRSSSIRFFNPDGVELSSPIFTLGAGDMQFTPDGQKLVVASRGLSAESQVTVLDISSPDWDACRQGLAGCTINSTSNAVSFSVFNNQRQTLLDAGVRLPEPNLSVAQDISIQDLTVSENSDKVWLTLGDNNAIAEIDLQALQFNEIFGLGVKDNSLAVSPFPDTPNSLPALLPGTRGNGLDASDQDGAINIQTWPIKSFFNPDNIRSYVSSGQTYLVTSNEGDADDATKARLNTLTLDSSNPAFPFQSNANLGRLEVSTVDGDTDGDGDFDETFGYGGRSFSIWTTEGVQIFDSGDDFEQITAAALPNNFNASSGNNSLDNRSDDRGPEPEAFDVGTIAGRNYLFLGFERVSGIMVYDITDPTAPSFQQYINNRNFAESPDSVLSEDVEPEGVFFISAADSPIPGVPMIAVSHEKSDSTTLYQIDLLGLPGDFNDDGRVDAADYAAWLANLGAADESGIANNGDGMNGVDLADYQLWQSNLSAPEGAGAREARVPEPSAAVLVMVGMLMILCRKLRGGPFA